METEAQMRALECRLLAHGDDLPWTALLIDNANCGVVAEKRQVAETIIWLTYSKSDRLWWIVWQDDRLRKLGYSESRRKDSGGLSSS